MNKPINKCKDCTERYVACSDTCTKNDEYKEYLALMRKSRKEKLDIYIDRRNDRKLSVLKTRR